MKAINRMIFLGLLSYFSVSPAANCLKDPDLCADSTSVMNCSGKHYQYATSLTVDQHGHFVKSSETVFFIPLQKFLPPVDFELIDSVLFYKDQPVERLVCHYSQDL